MTDWKLIAEAHGLTPQEAHVALMQQLEATVAVLKQALPLDTEPAPAFAPICAKESD
ncbi:MAG: hypothetical protein JNK48_23605 [Bryobacterales bacterium]|nr:hypothetical protein [Bryobacterales bacterium]